MFSRLKKLFKQSDVSTQHKKGLPTSKTKAADNKKPDLEIELSDNNDAQFKPLNHARELNIAFISSLLGSRAVATEESKAQEVTLRAALDAEMVGMSEDSIPKLSKSALNLMQTLMADDVDQDKIITAVNEDPGLAGKVLSIVNSPTYLAGDQKINDIPHALAMMGHERLKHAVMSSLMADKFELDAYYFETFGKALWEHSTEVAINAASMAKEAGANQGLAYFCGLIHDIGKLIIFKQLVELHQQEGSQPHPDVFTHLLNDYSHALTRRASEVWDLPDDWCLPIKEFQWGEMDEHSSKEAIALFLANHFSELNTLFVNGEITQFELVWRLQETNCDLDVFSTYYPNAVSKV